MIAAIVPAAGRSRRMGRPKLLLELEGRSILAGVVNALRQGGADVVVAVVPPATEPEGPALAGEAARAGARVVAPASRPAEMRDSIELALIELTRGDAAPPAAILIAPADSPGIGALLVGKVIGLREQSPGSIIIPRFDGRRGHPILIPWDLATRISDLPPDVGVNALVAHASEAGRVVELDVSDASTLLDLDTPEDWERWQARLGRGEFANSNPHRIKVRLFALARQRAGTPEIVVEVAEGATVADIKAAIARSFPVLADLLPSVLIAVDSEYASDEMVVPMGAQVAIIPPVSGGNRTMIEITQSAIDHAAITDRVRSNRAGAVCTFLGTVRELTGDRRTAALDYEAYPEMALKKMAEIDAEARRRWPIIESAIVHRVGHLDLGEISIVIAVSTPHRRQSFEACQWLIDTFKEVVPIWKKETWADGGEEWVHPGILST